MKWKPYPTYKPAETEWMAEVPAHWKVDRLKWSIDSARNGIWGDEPDGGPDDIVCVRVADFDRTSQTVDLSEPTHRKVGESDRGGRILLKGDLLLEKSGGGEGSPVGYVVEYTHDTPAVCSNFIARMVPSARVRSRFLRYLHQALYSARINLRSIKQTSGIQNLDAASYFNEMVPYPPPPEQAAIATFLDRETAKIDALIAEQRTLIERLREKRQATITNTTLRGLNPTVSLQDSGVTWIGEIPSNWQVRELRRLAKPGTSITYGIVQAGPEYEGGVPYIRTSDMGGDTLPLDGIPRPHRKLMKPMPVPGLSLGTS